MVSDTVSAFGSAMGSMDGNPPSMPVGVVDLRSTAYLI